MGDDSKEFKRLSNKKIKSLLYSTKEPLFLLLKKNLTVFRKLR